MARRHEGPVRSEAARVAILDAAAGLLATGGYERLTMEGIAREAGVGKQTIYRWWDSKAALIAECLLEGRILPGQLGIPQHADLRTDLVAWLGTLFDFLKQPSGGVLRSIIAVAAQSPDVGRRLRTTFTDGSAVEARLRRAVDDGDLRAEAPLSALAELIVGSVMARALDHDSPTVPSAAELVDALLCSNRPPAT